MLLSLALETLDLALLIPSHLLEPLVDNSLECAIFNSRRSALELLDLVPLLQQFPLPLVLTHGTTTMSSLSTLSLAMVATLREDLQ